jgi:hypothetical protein
MATVRSRKKFLAEEVEETLQQPFYSKPNTLYRLFNLKDLEAEKKKRKICALWNHDQERPEYKDFDAQ